MVISMTGRGAPACCCGLFPRRGKELVRRCGSFGLAWVKGFLLHGGGACGVMHERGFQMTVVGAGEMSPL